jgi:hypothetical protein
VRDHQNIEHRLCAERSTGCSVVKVHICDQREHCESARPEPIAFVAGACGRDNRVKWRCPLLAKADIHGSVRGNHRRYDVAT